jgi:predicted membrane protein
MKLTSTSLDAFGAAATPDADLIVGFATIVAACTPYVLGVFLPKEMSGFFSPIYKDNKAGRDAEIGWKVRYAALALALTVLIAAEVLWDPQQDIVDTLRDCYVVWGIFYTEATRKIRSEAKQGILAVKSRFGIQLWHSLVVIILWADVSTSPFAERITSFLKDVFT